MKRLLDTSAYIWLRADDREVRELVASAERLVFSVVVIGELLESFAKALASTITSPSWMRSSAGRR